MNTTKPKNWIPDQVGNDDKASRKPRVAIAMSGGVDSSVAAKILVDQGFEVVGFMMKLWSDPTCPSFCPRENACCDDQGVMDAKEAADKIGIPFYLVNAKEVFKKEIVDYFIDEYKNLRTPNPCAKCNEKIKFGWLLDFAQSVGCQYLATGHYARVSSESPIAKRQSPINNQFPNFNNQNNKDCHPEPACRQAGLYSGSRNYCMDSGSQVTGRNDNMVYGLLKGVDSNKDQSYFLYNLNQDQLSKILFPVGGYTKEEVRAMAKKWDLPVFEKRESQEICFIQDKDFRDFLKRNIPVEYFKSGQIVDKKGNILGEHEGLINYTIGQRKGIEQSFGSQISKSKLQISNKIQNTKSKTNDKTPLYVIGFNKKKNQLIVGEDKEVYVNEMNVENVHFIQNDESRIMNHGKLQVKIRYRHSAIPCKAIIHHSKYMIQFDEPQRAITPGQSAVFYDGDEVLGGGIIK